MIKTEVILYEDGVRHIWGKKMFPKYDDDFVVEMIEYFNSWDMYDLSKLKVDKDSDNNKLIFHMNEHEEEMDNVITKYQEDFEITFKNNKDYSKFITTISAICDENTWIFTGYAWIDHITIDKADKIVIDDESVTIYYNGEVIANAFLQYVDEVGYKIKDDSENISHIVYEY